MEEVKKHLGRGRPVMVYFSTELGSQKDFDVEQFAKLQEFKKWCMANGVYQDFAIDTDFRLRFKRHLPQSLNQHPYFKGGSGDGAGLSEPPKPNDPEPPAPRPAPAGSSNKSKGKASQNTSLENEILQQVAADPSGQLMILATLERVIYQAGTAELKDSVSKREQTSIEEAIENLTLKGLLKKTPFGGKGATVYEITAAGFRAADEMKP